MGKNIFKALTGPLLEPVDRATTVGGFHLLPAIATAIGGPVAGAAASGLSTIDNGGSWQQAIGNAAGNYIGGEIGGDFGGAGNVGPANTIGAELGQNLGSFGSSVSNILPASIAGQTFGGAIGSTLGSSVGSNLGGQIGASIAGPGNSGSPTTPATPPPSWRTASTLPTSLSGVSGLDSGQQSTDIATKGVYGGGAGDGERDYFLNLINSRLSDNDTANDNLQPIESSYLSQLGLGGSSDNADLLKKLSTYQG